MKISNKDVKVIYLALNKRIFNCIIAHHRLTIKEVATKLDLQVQNATRHIKRLYKDGFLTMTHNKQFQAENIDKFKKFQDDELAKYIDNNIIKAKSRSLSSLPLHIQEAIERGLISKDAIHQHCPIDDTPEHFKNKLSRTHKNLAWSGYSIYNMFNS